MFILIISFYITTISLVLQCAGILSHNCYPILPMALAKRANMKQSVNIAP